MEIVFGQAEQAAPPKLTVIAGEPASGKNRLLATLLNGAPSVIFLYSSYKENPIFNDVVFNRHKSLVKSDFTFVFDEVPFEKLDDLKLLREEFGVKIFAICQAEHLPLRLLSDSCFDFVICTYTAGPRMLQ